MTKELELYRGAYIRELTHELDELKEVLEGLEKAHYECLKKTTQRH